MNQTTKFINHLREAIQQEVFVKLSLGNYKGEEQNLKQIFVKPVVIKRQAMYAFTLRYQTKDIFKNFSFDYTLGAINNYLLDGFNVATLFTTTEEFILERNLKGAVKLRASQLKNVKSVVKTHDKEKKRLIAAVDNFYLNALGVTDGDGTVLKHAQDKFRQINQYVEILSSLIKELPENSIHDVVDMGSGKGYLTFALYDYLQQIVQKANVVGVEFRKDMVELCNAIAQQSSFDQLSFVEGTIDSYQPQNIDLLIALHACDTATDDAIYKGIKADAELIVVAPCCHKQIRREIEKNKAQNDLNFLTKHGIFLERQAEMVTDGLRALILEYFGYKTKVFEFVSDVHTPKNVMVVGIKSKKLKVKSGNLEVLSEEQNKILQKIKDTKAYFGIGYHHLERLLGL